MFFIVTCVWLCLFFHVIATQIEYVLRYLASVFYFNIFSWMNNAAARVYINLKHIEETSLVYDFRIFFASKDVSQMIEPVQLVSFSSPIFFRFFIYQVYFYTIDWHFHISRLYNIICSWVFFDWRHIVFICIRNILILFWAREQIMQSSNLLYMFIWFFHYLKLMKQNFKFSCKLLMLLMNVSLLKEKKNNNLKVNVSCQRNEQ